MPPIVGPIIIAVLVILVLLILAKNIVVVQQSKAFVVGTPRRVPGRGASASI